MHRRLIGKGEPDCTSITFEIEGGATFGEIDAIVNGIPYDGNAEEGSLHRIHLIVKAALRDLEFGEDEMTRMKVIIERQLQTLRKRAEDSVSDILISPVLEGKPSQAQGFVSPVLNNFHMLAADFLYGNTDGSDLRASCRIEERYVTLLSWTSQQWKALVQR